MIQKKSLLYLAICSKKNAPGVYKKIVGFVKGAEENGFICQHIILEPNSITIYFEFIRYLLTSKQEYIIIRYLSKIGIIIFLLGLILKFKNQKLLIDVPTPMKNHVRELLNSKENVFSNLLNMILIYLQGPIPFLSAKGIIQYANESKWFSIGNLRKQIIVGNGISVKSITMRESIPEWPSKQLNLIAVGTVAFWHGWDRIIKAIKIIESENNREFTVNFTIVGEGPEIKNLKSIVNLLGLDQRVKFTGMLQGYNLDREYEQAHLGIGSLGWYRIGVNEASPLKVREYLSVGLPVIYAAEDPDFSESSDIAIRISNDSDIESIVALFFRLRFNHIPSSLHCRQFAENNLDYKNKLKLILSQF